MTTRIVETAPMRICLVEDAASEAARLKSLLADSGPHQVCSTNSLRDAYERLRRTNSTNRYDIMLVSDTVADFTRESCRMLALDTAEGGTALVLLSRSSAQLEESWIRQVGAVDALPADITVSELTRRLTLILDLQKERRARKVREEALEAELAERKIMEARLKHLVDHDDLTGLPNRRRLDQALALAVIRSRNFHRSNALLYLDLDQFKTVNNTAGHAAGDRLLLHVANQIRSCMRSGQLAARIGADEFAILLEHISEADALAFAELLRSTISAASFSHGEATYHVSASIGVVLNIPAEEIQPGELLARADQACYLAKRQGRNTVYRFSREDEQLRALRSDALWLPVLKRALADDKFFLVFQPIMELGSRRIAHYEALIRMRGDAGEVHAPAEFIPVAERMGLIHQIDLWVVEHILDFLASLPVEQADIAMSVNLSGHAFQDRALLPLIRQKLDMTGLSASRMMFEITETAAVTNFSETRKMVAQLRALGCRFALDDFGAGFSSFSYIKNFPVDMLKIDGSFITNLLHDSTDQLLVKSMIEVAHSLGKKVVAEFVDNMQTLKLLTQFGADYVQGHFIGCPESTLVQREWPSGEDTNSADSEIRARFFG